MLDRLHFIPDREVVRLHSWYILDIRVTFEVRSKCVRGILAAFCLHFWTLELYSTAIPRAFWLHSYSIRGTFQLDFRRIIRAATELQSCSIRSAFGTLGHHSKYSYCVPTIFELHSRANALRMCKNHSMCVRRGFLVFERHSWKKCHSFSNVARILKN